MSGLFKCEPGCGFQGSIAQFDHLLAVRYCRKCTEEQGKPVSHNVRACPFCGTYHEPDYDHLAAGSLHV